MKNFNNDLDKAEYLQDMLISQSTGENADNGEYKELRGYFLLKEDLSNFIPDFLRTKRDLGQFWSFIKMKFPTYKERREYIYNSFSDLLNFEENKPNKSVLSSILVNKNFDTISINTEMQKALDRVKNDPEGAITLARTILESVCKNIADEIGITYTDNTELSILYKQVSKQLNLSPDQHNEYVFKQILGGCSAIVNGLGTLRNKLGDAHGRSFLKIKPSTRHAELAVNLAWSMVIFLLETNEFNKITP